MSGRKNGNDMELLGTHLNRNLYYTDIAGIDLLPKGNWVYLAIANTKPTPEDLDKVIIPAINNEALEFIGCGEYGEYMHDWFDETAVGMVVIDGHEEIETMTTWHTESIPSNALWDAFTIGGNCNLEDHEEVVNILCTSLDGTDYMEMIKEHIQRFNDGWVPE